MRTTLLWAVLLCGAQVQAAAEPVRLAQTESTRSRTKPAPVAEEPELEPLTPAAAPAPKPTAAPVNGLAACAQGPDRAMIEGPVVLGFFAVDQATGRRACPRTEVGLVLGGDAEIDIPRYRALMGGGATLFGSYAVNDRLEVFGTFEAFRMTYSQNASLSVTVPGVGQLSGGATYSLWTSGSSVLGVTGRLVLPTASSTVNVRTTAVELGALFSHRLGSAFELHGLLGSDLAFGISSATPQPRLGFLVGLGGQWAPVSWFALALDLQTHFGDRGSFDYLAPSLGLRFKVHPAIGMELGLATHVLGDRSISLSPGLRTESVVALRTSYRF